MPAVSDGPQRSGTLLPLPVVFGIRVPFYKCIPCWVFVYLGLLKCIFLYRETGRFCRSRTAMVAVPDRQNLPVKLGGDRRFS